MEANAHRRKTTDTSTHRGRVLAITLLLTWGIATAAIWAFLENEILPIAEKYPWDEFEFAAYRGVVASVLLVGCGALAALRWNPVVQILAVVVLLAAGSSAILAAWIVPTTLDRFNLNHLQPDQAVIHTWYTIGTLQVLSSLPLVLLNGLLRVLLQSLHRQRRESKPTAESTDPIQEATVQSVNRSLWRWAAANAIGWFLLNRQFVPLATQDDEASGAFLLAYFGLISALALSLGAVLGRRFRTYGFTYVSSMLLMMVGVFDFFNGWATTSVLAEHGLRLTGSRAIMPWLALGMLQVIAGVRNITRGERAERATADGTRAVASSATPKPNDAASMTSKSRDTRALAKRAQSPQDPANGHIRFSTTTSRLLFGIDERRTYSLFLGEDKAECIGTDLTDAFYLAKRDFVVDPMTLLRIRNGEGEYGTWYIKNVAGKSGMTAASFDREGNEAIAEWVTGKSARELAELYAQRTSVSGQSTRSTIHTLAQTGTGQAIKSVLEGGADVDLQNDHGATPLYIAALHGNFDAAVALIEAGADKNLTNNAGKTPLSAAEENRHTRLIELLRT